MHKWKRSYNFCRQHLNFTIKKCMTYSLSTMLYRANFMALLSVSTGICVCFSNNNKPDGNRVFNTRDCDLTHCPFFILLLFYFLMKLLHFKLFHLSWFVFFILFCFVFLYAFLHGSKLISWREKQGTKLNWGRCYPQRQRELILQAESSLLFNYLFSGFKSL